MNNGVRFGDKHSYEDFGLILNTKTIKEPSVQTKLVNVPGRNGSIDLTEVLTGDVRYNDRTITMKFTIMEHFTNWELKREELANYLHGRDFKIIFDDDLAYYWLGRVNVGDLVPTKSTAEINIEATVQPYKYNITIDDSDWLWNPFDFENDVINNIKVDVDGSFNYHINANGRAKSPIMTVEGNLSVQYDGEEAFTLPVGTNVIYQIVLTEGSHDLLFTGNGSVSVDYVGGRL